MKEIRNIAIITMILTLTGWGMVVNGQSMSTVPVPGANRSTAGTPELTMSKVFSFPFKDVDRFPVITAVAISLDGSRIYTGGDDCQLYVWDVEKGKLIHNFKAHEDWIRGIALSPDGKELATIDQNGKIHIWETGDFKPVRTIEEKVPGAQTIDYSPNGKVLAAAGFEPYIWLFDAGSGKRLARWQMTGNNVKTVKFSPKGDQLAAGGRDGVVRIWDTASGRALYSLDAGGRRIHAVAFSQDGTRVAAGGESANIYVWEAKTGQSMAKIPTEIGKVFSLQFCGNDRLASGDSFNLIRLWNISTTKETAHGSGHTGTIATLLFRSDKNELISGSFDTTVRYWNLK